MKTIYLCLIGSLVYFVDFVSAFQPYLHRRSKFIVKREVVPKADIEVEQAPEDEIAKLSNAEENNSMIPNRGKVNEIDFCIAPADVSLSRAYSISNDDTKAKSKNNIFDSKTQSNMSLTRALNNASNRAVRRILLARSWPSAEALNMSLRQVAAAEKEREAARMAGLLVAGEKKGRSTAKCPVPRPILNILMRRQEVSSGKSLPTKNRTDEEYVADQLKSFQDKYGEIPGYSYAEAYLESVLRLATSGEESERVSEVMESGIYDESYTKMTAVLRSVGVVFEEIPGTNRSKIARKLVDQEICLALYDKLNVEQTKTNADEGKKIDSKEKIPVVPEDDSIRDNEDESSKADGKFRVQFWKQDKNKKAESTSRDMDEATDSSEDKEEDVEIKQEDLGGVLLSAEEPSMTRNLNVLSNIVRRALLFGGDQELLVLYETLVADLPPFIERWYPKTGGMLDESKFDEETRPGVQYLNCLVRLLANCYTNGFVSDLEPPLPLIPSYRNAYERLMTNLVELGSGYVRPVPSNVMSMPKPRTPTEELGRFAVWESTFRQQTSDVSSYPEDLEGTWEVRDEIGGEVIGVSTVVLGAQGQVSVDQPMEGLRWRLDPGPTHLDTCTFQILGDDGTILQYRGFVDRGARLESRFSKRPIKIRGSVMFQMRDGDAAIMGEGYWKDMLPINYKTGTTKFVMTKQIEDKR